MPRPIQATIHTAALRHNLARARQAAAAGRALNKKAPAPGRGFAFHALRSAYIELRITAAITPVATETST